MAEKPLYKAGCVDARKKLIKCLQRPTFCSILLKLSVFSTDTSVITGGPLGTGNKAGKLQERLERKERIT